MLWIAAMLSLLSSGVNANDHCEARRDIAYQAYLSRQPDTSTVLERNDIVREANSPVEGSQHISETGRELAAKAFADRVYQECKRND